MKKRVYLWFLLLLIPIAIFICFMIRFILCPNTAEWLELSLSTAGTIATIVLGVMVYIQSERHKASTDKYVEEQDKQALLYREEEQKRRDQDLLIKANPSVFIKGISHFALYNGSSILGANDYVNRLTDEPIDSKFTTFSCNLSFDIIFNVPTGNVVDRITVKQAKLSCTNGLSLTSNEFKQPFEKNYVNYSTEESKSNLKLSETGEVISYLGLYSFKDKRKDIEQPEEFEEGNERLINLLAENKNVWVLTIYYGSANSHNVQMEYNTQIVFRLINLKGVGDFYSADIEIKDTCTWLKKGAHLITQGENK